MLNQWSELEYARFCCCHQSLLARWASHSQIQLLNLISRLADRSIFRLKASLVHRNRESARYWLLGWCWQHFLQSKCLSRKFRVRLVMSLEKRDYWGHSEVALGTVLEHHQEGERDYGIACTHTHTHTHTQRSLVSLRGLKRFCSTSVSQIRNTFQLCLMQCVPLWCEICTY